ncbi:hypothetical protein ACOSQ4_017114 [Xanthoceras sorbifolium]
MECDDIDGDPQRYREEWFDVDLSLQKEFKLPNLSCPLFNCSKINANPPVSFSSISPPISTNRVCVQSISSLRSCSPSWLTTPRNQPQVPISDSFLSINNVGGVNFPEENHSSPNFHPSGSQFSNSGTFNPWSCPNQQYPRSNLNNFNETTSNHISSTPAHDHGQSGTSSEPKPNMIELAISRGPSSSNGPVISIKDEPETLVPNYQNLIKPKQEIQETNGKDQEHGTRLIKTSVSEPQSDDSESGDHRCFVCNLIFASRNALGGHVSYPAKKRKTEVMKNGGISVVRADVDGRFEDEEEDTRADAV